MKQRSKRGGKRVRRAEQSKVPKVNAVVADPNPGVAPAVPKTSVQDTNSQLTKLQEKRSYLVEQLTCKVDEFVILYKNLDTDVQRSRALNSIQQILGDLGIPQLQERLEGVKAASKQ